MATANKARPAKPPDIGQAKENRTKQKKKLMQHHDCCDSIFSSWEGFYPPAVERRRRWRDVFIYISRGNEVIIDE